MKFLKGEVLLSGSLKVTFTNAELVKQLQASSISMKKFHEELMKSGAVWDGQDGYDMTHPTIDILIGGVPWTVPAEHNSQSIGDIMSADIFGAPKFTVSMYRPKDADGWEFREFIGNQKGCNWTGFKIWAGAPDIPGAHPRMVQATCEEFNL